jgi:flagellar hook-associated protein 1 FlgK
MATLSTAWNISMSALKADQMALATTANNTANATTPGYTEEAAIWQQADPIQIGLDSVGDGVVDLGAASQRDLVLNKSIDLQTQVQAASASRLTALQNLQATFASATSVSDVSSSDGGISSSLSNFFSSLAQLEASPSDVSVRQSVLASASTLASSFNAAASSLEQQQDSLNGEVSSVVTQANGLLTSLAGLNAQIRSQDPNKDAGILEDQRQQDLQSLSQLLGVQQTTTEKNGISLSTVNGIPLVEGSTAAALSVTEVNGVTHIYAGSSDITQDVLSGGGQAGGMVQVANQDIPTAMTAMDSLAYQVGTQINTLNEGGTDLNGNAGTAVFSLPTAEAGTARAISVALTDPSTIAAASSGGGSADGTNAAAMAALASTSLSGLTNLTPANYYASFVSALGSTVSSVDSNNTAQQASLSQVKNQQTALSGVSLDAEATSLETMEQAYQAASKVFTIVNDLVTSAINLGYETPAS